MRSRTYSSLLVCRSIGLSFPSNAFLSRHHHVLRGQGAGSFPREKSWPVASEVVCEHVARRSSHGLHSLDPIHQRDLSLLLMPYRVRHETEPRIAGRLPFGMPHGDRTRVVVNELGRLDRRAVRARFEKRLPRVEWRRIMKPDIASWSLAREVRPELRPMRNGTVRTRCGYISRGLASAPKSRGRCCSPGGHRTAVTESFGSALQSGTSGNRGRWRAGIQRTAGSRSRR